MKSFFVLSLIPALKRYFCNHVAMKIPFHFVRRWYLEKIINIKIGKDSHIGMECIFMGDLIQIGENSVINRFSYLDGRGVLKIGSNVNISNYVYIQTLTHDPQDTEFKCVSGPVIIENNVWIGARAIVLPGVKVGEGAVVGAGSVVTRNIPPYCIAVGSPARVIKERNRNLNYKTIYKPLFG